MVWKRQCTSKINLTPLSKQQAVAAVIYLRKAWENAVQGLGKAKCRTQSHSPLSLLYPIMICLPISKPFVLFFFCLGSVLLVWLPVDESVFLFRSGKGSRL